MKKEILKLTALLLFGAAALTSCSIENRGYRNDRYRHNKHHDRDHDGYYNRNNGYDRDHSYHNGY